MTRNSSYFTVHEWSGQCPTEGAHVLSFNLVEVHLEQLNVAFSWYITNQHSIIDFTQSCVNHYLTRLLVVTVCTRYTLWSAPDLVWSWHDVDEAAHTIKKAWENLCRLHRDLVQQLSMVLTEDY